MMRVLPYVCYNLFLTIILTPWIRRDKMKKYLIDILLLAIGALLFAIAVNVFVIPNDLGEGGVTGLTIISYYLFE